MAMLKQIEEDIKFVEIVKKVQAEISRNFYEVLQKGSNDVNIREKIISFIIKYNDNNRHIITGVTSLELAHKIYNELREYSILTELLKSTELEEININSWDDISLRYRNGKQQKTKGFYSKQNAVDIVKRLLSNCNQIIDETTPTVEGHFEYFGNKLRITAMIPPIVDNDAGISVAIRVLNNDVIDKEIYIKQDFVEAKELEFLQDCLRYGVSMIIAGKVGSGKTTFQNYLLSTIPDQKRIFTIETGSRELNLVKRDENGNVLNNIIHTLTKHHENPIYAIKQEDLIVKSLRFSPDLIAVAEIRDIEAYAGQEASLTGNTVITTLHAGSAQKAHHRLAELCRKKYPTDYTTAMLSAAQAFPLVIVVHMLGNQRKIMSVTECIGENESRKYVPLFHYEVDDNLENGDVIGKHVQDNKISDSLINHMKMYGVPKNVLKKYIGG